MVSKFELAVGVLAIIGLATVFAVDFTHSTVCKYIPIGESCQLGHELHKYRQIDCTGGRSYHLCAAEEEPCTTHSISKTEFCQLK